MQSCWHCTAVSHQQFIAVSMRVVRPLDNIIKLLSEHWRAVHCYPVRTCWHEDAHTEQLVCGNTTGMRLAAYVWQVSCHPCNPLRKLNAGGNITGCYRLQCLEQCSVTCCIFSFMGVMIMISTFSHFRIRASCDDHPHALRPWVASSWLQWV